MVKNAAFSIQSSLIESIVLPNFVPFGYLIYASEVAVGVSGLICAKPRKALVTSDVQNSRPVIVKVYVRPMPSVH